MLLDMSTLDAIFAGRVTLVFRKWRRPTVRAGGTLKTARGVIGIDRIDPVSAASITERDARHAGFATRAHLLKELNRRKQGAVYRIALHPAGPDPRVALRKRSRMTADEFAVLSTVLMRLDKASTTGPWTLAVLSAILRHPDLPAGQLAEHLGYERERLKLDVRKLKNLGLTESRSPGYRVSPRGRAALAHMEKSLARAIRGYVTLEDKLCECTPAQRRKIGARAAEIRAKIARHEIKSRKRPKLKR